MSGQAHSVEVSDLIDKVTPPVPGGSITTFRSNIRDDHFVVALNTQDNAGDDAATLRYVNLEQAIELRSVFNSIVEDLGGVGFAALEVMAYSLGRDGEYKATRQLMAETFGLDYDGKV